MLALLRSLLPFALLFTACSSESAGEPDQDDFKGEPNLEATAHELVGASCRFSLLRGSRGAECLRYHVDEIPPADGFGSTTPGSLNSAGLIAGSLEGSTDSAFIHGAGVTRALNVFDRVSGASAINALGDVVGTSMQAGRPDTFRPFQWLSGAAHPVDLMTVLPNTAVDGVGADMNDTRDVVGTFEIQAAGLKPHPFVYRNASAEVTILHPPGATYAYATAINAANQVIGHLWGVAGKGFLYDLTSGQYSPLTFEPEAINDAGLVVGNRDDATPVMRPPGGRNRLLPTFGTSSCRALAVNNSGVIVGTAALPTADAPIVAVVFEGGSVVNLNERLAVGDPWHVVVAHDINDAGVMVGLAIRRDDPSRALRGVRLTPASYRVASALPEFTTTVNGDATLTARAAAESAALAPSPSSDDTLLAAVERQLAYRGSRRLER